MAFKGTKGKPSRSSLAPAHLTITILARLLTHTGLILLRAMSLPPGCIHHTNNHRALLSAVRISRTRPDWLSFIWMALGSKVVINAKWSREKLHRKLLLLSYHYRRTRSRCQCRGKVRGINQLIRCAWFPHWAPTANKIIR